MFSFATYPDAANLYVKKLCRIKFLIAAAAIVLLTLHGARAYAQSLNALPSPNVELLRPGQVLAMERLPDGKLLLAGDFIRIGAVSRPGIARLTSSGLLDANFTPGFAAEFGIRQLLTDASGRTYVLNGSRLRRMTASGAVDPSFTNVTFNPTSAQRMALVSDGIIVGGNFTTILTTPAVARAGLVKINFDGSVDANFELTTSDVSTVQASGNDEVLLGGGFTTVGTVARTGLARVSTLGAGSVLASWNPQLTRSAGAVRVVDALISADAVVVTGLFDTVAGTPRARFAKLSLSSATLDANWNISAPSIGNARLFQHNGSLLVSTANFSVYANPPAAVLPARRVMRASLTGNGSIDASFAPDIVSDGSSVAVAIVNGDSPARMAIGGSFLGIGSLSRFALAQLNADGTPDTVVALSEASAVANVSQVQFEPVSQRTYLSGNFLRADGNALRYFLRLNSNGSVDTSWRPQTDDRLSPAFSVVAGSGVFVASNAGIKRLRESDGQQVNTWVNSSSSVSALLAANNAIYAVIANQIARFPILSNGAIDATFVPAFTGIGQMHIDVGGNTLVVAGLLSNGMRMARINASSGALIASFAPTFADANGALGVQGFALDGAGGVWAAGNFTLVNGVARVSPVRLLLSNGAIDPSSAAATNALFNNGLGFNQGFFYGLRFTSGGNAEVRRMPLAGGPGDVSWQVSTGGGVDAIEFQGEQLLLGGDFTRLGVSPRLSFGSVPRTETMLLSGFE